MTRNPVLMFALVLALGGLVAAQPANAQWSMTANDGQSQLKLGFFAQLQGEALRNPGSQELAQNVFVRRARLMLGGRVDARTAFFIDTETANLGKGQSSGVKGANTMVIQDLVITRTVRPGVHVDAGMMYVPTSHHSQQAVGSLLAVDYGAHSFLQSDVTDSKSGRDYGVNGRVYFGNRHGELRAGVYQGDRGRNSTLPFRTAVRGVFYPFEADTGFFYSGTAFGKKRLVALGGSYDAQKSYYSWAGDVTVDWPLRQDCVTLLADYMRYDGGATFVALPRQDAVLVELGYTIHRAHLTPFVQYAARDYDDPARADEARIQGGLAFWSNGHRDNIKLGVSKLMKDGVSDGIQYVGQWQLLAF